MGIKSLASACGDRMANVDVWCPFCEQIDFIKKHCDGNGVTVIGLVSIFSHPITPIVLICLKSRQRNFCRSSFINVTETDGCTICDSYLQDELLSRAESTLCRLRISE